MSNPYSIRYPYNQTNVNQVLPLVALPYGDMTINYEHLGLNLPKIVSIKSNPNDRLLTPDEIVTFLTSFNSNNK